MSETTTLEKPAEVTPETQAAPATETQAPVNPESTDGGSEPVQTETPSEPDEGELLRKAEREAWEAEAEDRIRQRLEAQQVEVSQQESHAQLQQRIAQTVAELNTVAPQAMAAMRAELRGMSLDDGQIQLALRHFEAFNLRNAQIQRTLADSHGRLAYGPIEAAVEASLPKDAYTEFKKAADGKPARDFLEAFAEQRAPATKYIKSLNLEDAQKHSPKLKAEITKALADKYTEGRNKGRTDPPGDPAHNGARTISNSTTFATAAENDRAFNEQRIDRETWKKNEDILRPKRS